MVKHDVFCVFSQCFPTTRVWVLGRFRVLGVSVGWHINVLGKDRNAKAHIPTLHSTPTHTPLQLKFLMHTHHLTHTLRYDTRQVEQKPGGRGREWATLGVHPLSWLLSNNRLEKVPFVSVPHTSSNRLLLSNQDKGCTPSVAHSLALPRLLVPLC